MSLDAKVNRVNIVSLWRQWRGALANLLQSRDALRIIQDQLKAAGYDADEDCDQKDIDLVTDAENKLKAIE